ncbi:hypothetical protein [Stygiolobus caldivivus]|uniref:Uncharacterized protein n=1 Tax=Stygiolobus caldivivus TaxID=2824673 RepID=A0A8D5ZK68_9CREN|nr:hypothetical protein [Stygiolobus caldivivus]BCU71070.1 hypothetical protein KN1_23670 [Stygiolobus caldivivus]
MECEKEALSILDILFNSNLIRGRVVFEDDIKHLMQHEKFICSENDIIKVLKIYLRPLGIIIVKGSYDNYRKVIKTFEDGGRLVEGVYGVEYDLIDENELLDLRIILYNDSVIIHKNEEERKYKLTKVSAIRVLKEISEKSRTKNEFINSLLNFLENNNDDKTIEWLKDFLVHKASS